MGTIGKSAGNPILLLLFKLGAHEPEIRRCLEKCRPALIATGVRADNIPAQAEKRLALVAGLEGKALEIVRKWFHENAKFEGVMDPTVVAKELISFDATELPPLKQGRELWRGLLAVYVDPIRRALSDELINSLIVAMQAETTPVGNERKQSGDGAQLRVNVAGSEASARRYDGIVLEHILAVSEIVVGDWSHATILGTRTRLLDTGQLFIRIEAILTDEGVVALSQDEARRFFPDSGDATAFPGTVSGAVAAYEGLASWRIEHNNASHKTQFAATAFGIYALDVIRVPYPSGEHDKVREWLQAYRPTSGIRPIFELADGLVVKFPGELAEATSNTFDSPLHAFHRLPAVAWGAGRHVVVTLLPISDQRYECAPPQVLLKRLFKAAGEAGMLPVISKAQLAELGRRVADEAGDQVLRRSSERILARASAAFETEDLVAQAVDGLMALPLVKDELSKGKSSVIEAFRAEQAAAGAGLLVLRADKERLQADLAKLRETTRKEAAGVSKEVKDAFEKAAKDGAKTLASVAVYKAALAMDAPRTSAATPSPTARVPLHDSPPLLAPMAPQGRPITGSGELQRAINRVAERDGLSRAMLAAMVAGVAVQGCIALSGRGQAAVLVALATVLSGGTMATVSVSSDQFSMADLMNATAMVAGGPERAMALGDFIERQLAGGGFPLVYLRGANRSPPESYMPELEALTRNAGNANGFAWSDRNGQRRSIEAGRPLAFVLDITQGRSTFPFTALHAWSLPWFDTDFAWNDAGAADRSLPPAATHVGAEIWDTLRAPPAAGGGLPRGLPRAANEAARRVATAATALGLEVSDAQLLAFALLGIGRLKQATVSDAVSGGTGPAASSIKEFVTDANQATLALAFDIE